MSQLLARIDAELQSVTDSDTAGRLLARKSAYTARMGRFPEAKALIADLRLQFGESRSGPVTPWIMRAEGLLHYFEDLGPRALDRVRRTQLLAVALGDTELVAIASAWKAHMEFERSLFKDMGQSLAMAQAHAAPDNHTAHTRLAMVFCDALLLCGDKQRGQTWFMRGREHALAEGDQASMEAILYNRAAFNLAWIRAQHHLGIAVADQLPLLRMEFDSGRNLHHLMGFSGTGYFVSACEYRLLVLERKFGLAIEKMRALRGIAALAEYSSSEAMLDLESTYCQFKLGALSVHERSHPVGWPSALEKLDIDEQLAAAAMILEMAEGGFSETPPAEARSRYERICSAYQATNAAIMDALQPFCGPA